MSHITVSFSDLLPRLVELWSESHMKWGTSYLKWVTSYIKWVTLYLSESWVTHSCVKFMHCEVSHSRTTCLVACATHMWDVTHLIYDIIYQMSHITYQWVVRESLTNDVPCCMCDSHVSHTSNEARHVSNESHHISMSHVTHEWVMECSHANESWDICMSHVTYKWVAYDIRHVMYETSHVPHECHGSYERVMAHMKRRRCDIIRMWRDVFHMWNESRPTWNESRPTWMSWRIWKRYGSYKKEERPDVTASICDVTYSIYEMSHVLHEMSHVICEWVILHKWVTSHMNVTYEWVMERLAYEWVTRFVRDVTHSYVTGRIHAWQNSCQIWMSYVTYEQRIHMYMRRNSFNAFICICDGTNSYMMWLIQTWRDSSILDVTNADVTWLVHM